MADHWHGGTRAAKLEVKEVLALIFSFLFNGKVDLDVRGAVTICPFCFYFNCYCCFYYYLFL